VDEIFKMEFEHFGAVEPIGVELEAFGDVGEFDIRAWKTKDADHQAFIETVQFFGIVAVMVVVGQHFGDVENMGNNDIARVAEDEKRDKIRAGNPLYNFRPSQKVSGAYIQWTQGVQIIKRILHAALFPFSKAPGCSPPNSSPTA